MCIRDSSKALNIVIPGNKPKLTISAKESSCAPRLELDLSALAIKPSKKSKINEMIIHLSLIHI